MRTDASFTGRGRDLTVLSDNVSKANYPPIGPARRAAFDILRRVETERAYASVLVASLPQSDFLREDRALAHEIVLGVLRWQKSLDYFIERYSHRSVQRLDLTVVLALRMGLYQLRHLTRIPHSAAVNESVNLVKVGGVRSAAGFVNGVLRTAARQLTDTAGDEIEDPADRASIELSHPRWLLERWSAFLGESESRALALANNQAQQPAFRVNLLRATVEEVTGILAKQGVVARESKYVADSFVVEGERTPLVQAAEQGLIYLQDEASQLVSILVDPRTGERILDLCAAPGSKTSHIAALTKNESWIVACDVRSQRLSTLRSTCVRLGAEQVDVVTLDGTMRLPFLESAQTFDRVLVDAPCTGTGTLSQNPEIKWRLAPDDAERLSESQQALLSRGAEMVAVGGRVVYSTCSVEPDENEAVVAGFLAANRQFRLIEPNAHGDLITSEGYVRTFRHRHGMDCFFAAVMRRIAR